VAEISRPSGARRYNRVRYKLSTIGRIRSWRCASAEPKRTERDPASSTSI